MKYLKKALLALAFALLCALTLTGCGEQEATVTVTLVNRSGHGITSVCITPSTDTDWGENYVDELLGDDESVLAVLGTYKESEIPTMWNILVYGEEDYILYDTSVDELDFELTDGDYVVFLPPEGEVPIEITNHYNPDEYDETPEDYSDDLTGYTFEEEEDLSVGLAPFVGCWKYDEEPFYLVIGDDYEWVAINLYGERVNPGQVVVQEGDIALYLPDGNYFTTLNETAYGGLSDEKGNSLTACDEIILLPVPDDELDQTASFPGGFPNVTINYPSQMEAHEHPRVSNALSFNAVMEAGTEDYYSNIMIAFQPISGYDDYMTQGAAVAKPYMKHMLDGLLSSMYGNKVLKSFGSNFKDNGDHYSMTGYMWLDGSIFNDGPNQPVRGCIEVRYYGPTGYALVAVTIAVEGRIRNYSDTDGVIYYYSNSPGDNIGYDSVFYRGNVVNGAAHGNGTLYYLDYGQKSYESSREISVYTEKRDPDKISAVDESIMYVGEFKDGLMDGKGKMYKNGALTTEGTWKSGKKDGFVTEYDAYSDEIYLAFEGNYSNGVKNGAGIEYAAKGNPQFEGVYKCFDGTFENGSIKHGKHYGLTYNAEKNCHEVYLSYED